MNTKSILDRADTWLEDVEECTHGYSSWVEVAVPLIRDMRDCIAGMDKRTRALLTEIRQLSSYNCNYELTNRIGEAVIDALRPKPENNDGR